MNVAQDQTPTSLYANTGFGPQFSVLKVGLEDRVAVVEPDRAFWALVERDSLNEALAGPLIADYRKQAAEFQEEMELLRFGLHPSAVYFNPTERCNLNCSYCYLPEEMRRQGPTMTAAELCAALEQLLAYFRATLPGELKPQLIFHGSEPLLAREAMFAGIERYRDDFQFGIQTNGTLLDDEAIAFITGNAVALGLSLDAPAAALSDAQRKGWNGGGGAHARVLQALDKLASYPALNVITTVTRANVQILPEMVDFFHRRGIRVVMFNPVRCTRPGGLDLKPDNAELAHWFARALDRTFELFEATGGKLVVANFANVLAGIVGPTGRRLMCDISPCGGGRCFFAVSARGEVFPCSEFIGFPEFRGGRLGADPLPQILHSPPFKAVKERRVEHITPCATCAIRHFCGAPCPAEVHALSGSLEAPSPYCQFYEEQVRYAFRVIARQREAAFLWDGWQEETESSFHWC